MSTSGDPERERILVVDDAEPIRRMIGSMLTQNGYTVLEAADGNEALNVLTGSSEPIHLVLTDLLMPRMSGTELARHLGRLRPELPIVLMSGYTEDPVLRVTEPAFLFLAKPFTATALMETVRSALARPAPDISTASSRACPQ